MKIIFLCTGNSARSQMAEGFAEDLKEKVYEDKDFIRIKRADICDSIIIFKSGII